MASLIELLQNPSTLRATYRATPEDEHNDHITVTKHVQPNPTLYDHNRVEVIGFTIVISDPHTVGIRQAETVTIGGYDLASVLNVLNMKGYDTFNGWS